MSTFLSGLKRKGVAVHSSQWRWNPPRPDCSSAERSCRVGAKMGQLGMASEGVVEGRRLTPSAMRFFICHCPL